MWAKWLEIGQCPAVISSPGLSVLFSELMTMHTLKFFTCALRHSSVDKLTLHSIFHWRLIPFPFHLPLQLTRREWLPWCLFLTTSGWSASVGTRRFSSTAPRLGGSWGLTRHRPGAWLLSILFILRCVCVHACVCACIRVCVCMCVRVHTCVWVGNTYILDNTIWGEIPIQLSLSLSLSLMFATAEFCSGKQARIGHPKDSYTLFWSLYWMFRFQQTVQTWSHEYCMAIVDLLIESLTESSGLTRPASTGS